MLAAVDGPLIRSSVLAVVLLIVNIVNVGILHQHFGAHDGRTTRHTYFGSDYPYTLPIPQNDQVVMSMDIKSSQYPAIGNATDIEWLTLTSTNIGWARLGPSRRLFQPSFFHEQHCLRQIVLGLNHVPNAPISHVRHCLQYLRQMALCQSDLTLEPVSGNPEDIFEWDTSAGSHKCKDWTLPMEKMEQNLREWQKYLGNH